MFTSLLASITSKVKLIYKYFLFLGVWTFFPADGHTNKAHCQCESKRLRSSHHQHQRTRERELSPASPWDAKLTPVIHLCGALEISRLFGMDDELKVAGDKEQREARSSAALLSVCATDSARQTWRSLVSFILHARRSLSLSRSRIICIFANR